MTEGRMTAMKVWVAWLENPNQRIQMPRSASAKSRAIKISTFLEVGDEKGGYLEQLRTS